MIKILSLLIGISIFFSQALANSEVEKTLAQFKAFQAKAKQSYERSKKSENSMAEHVIWTENLALSELLPNKGSELKSFCKEYPQIIASQYNESDIKVLLRAKGPSIKNFYKFVKKNCDNKKF